MSTVVLLAITEPAYRRVLEAGRPALAAAAE